MWLHLTDADPNRSARAAALTSMMSVAKLSECESEARQPPSEHSHSDVRYAPDISYRFSVLPIPVVGGHG